MQDTVEVQGLLFNKVPHCKFDSDIGTNIMMMATARGVASQWLVISTIDQDEYWIAIRRDGPAGMDVLVSERSWDDYNYVDALETMIACAKYEIQEEAE